MKRFLFSAVIAGLSTVASAAGPYNLSIGSGAGSITINNVYSDGFIDGDTATFNPGDATPTETVWQSCFLVHNVTDNQSYWSQGQNASPARTPLLGDGTVANSATNVTNFGIPLGSGHTADLVTTLSAPTPGDTAKLAYLWTVTNTTSVTKTFRILWFVDVDVYISGNYTDDMIAQTPSEFTTSTALAVGENSGGLVNLNRGLRLDSTVPLDGFFAISLPTGASNYWDNDTDFAGRGPEVSKGIFATDLNKYMNDANNDHLSDSPADCGSVMQVLLNVAPGSSQSVTYSMTWGLNLTQGPTLPAAAADWQMFQ